MTLPDTIAAPLRAALDARGYSDLTPVQSAMLEERALDADLLVSAQTGSGKTVAFGLALAPLLLPDGVRTGFGDAPQALLIAPTRELAMQVRRELEWLYADTGARFASCIGGMDYRRELRALGEGAQIVVGTPGRLRDHITRGSLDLSDLKAAVLDEADEMLDLGFREDLEFILDAAPEERRTLLFSATVAPPIEKLAKTYQRDAVRIALTSRSDSHADIEYRVMPVRPNERDHAVVNTLLWFDSKNTIIFCQTREAVRHLASRLTNRGFPVVALSGELTQAERSNALQSMRDGRARVCVATDVAARGIDLPNLDLVIHADLPGNPETLLHRSGRTGRAGRKGVSVVIAPHHRRRSAERVLNAARVDASYLAVPDAAAVEARQVERMLADASLSLPIETDEVDLIERLLADHNPRQIAAAWIRAQRATMPTPEEVNAVPDAPPRREVGERPDTRFQNGVWFSLSIGRKQSAEPRWILPIICKAGGVTRAAVGSIRILDHETRFEIETSVADAFAAAVAKGGALEKGARIVPADGEGAGAPARKPHRKGTKPPEHKGGPGKAGAKDWGDAKRPGKRERQAARTSLAAEGEAALGTDRFRKRPYRDEDGSGGEGGRWQRGPGGGKERRDGDREPGSGYPKSGRGGKPRDAGGGKPPAHARKGAGKAKPFKKPGKKKS
ncbi:helicase [Zhengella mangrovi]|uniref:Helicase n=1 Tax=Zhengella mangrovi TaxID=1982044 RepID=A0A2G1QP30_9HYPH|nr:DEAD/DEAH box helicase [Zhengella mangrovi]PHP67273.1 helicase [Zhengella mangrovi]